MESPNLLISQICQKASQTFQEFAASENVGKLPYLEWDFKGSDTLWDEGWGKDIRKQGDTNPFAPVFNEIKEKGLKKMPALYLFTLEAEIDSTELIRTYISKMRAFSHGGHSDQKRAFAACTGKKTSGKYLYVGKVKKDIDLRLVVHLGYGKNAQTAGLQFRHWLPEAFPELTLRLQVFGFPDMNMAPLIGALEYLVASTYKPIIGKHT